MIDMRVSLPGMELDNPVIPASGTFGFGYEFAELYDINVLGSISIKGTTAQPRFGNPTPRIAETPSGMLNSVGLQNPGAEAVFSQELEKLRRVYKKQVIANISGFRVEDYVEASAAADGHDMVAIIELNISCPNVHGGGMSFGTSPASASEVTKAVKAAVRKPVFVKLTPNVTDITQIAKACESAGADGLSLINTVVGMRIDLRSRRPILHNSFGGLSGPAIFPVAVADVYKVYEAVDIPIIGMGGIASARDVVEMMLAGAAAVQVGAENLRDPFACPKIIGGLPAVMEEYGIDKLSDITGGAHHG